jgi:hypothetical protein
MFRSSMRSSSGSCLFISLSMQLILKIIKIFKKYYQSIVVVWQHMFSVPVTRTVWRCELDSWAPAHVSTHSLYLHLNFHLLKQKSVSWDVIPCLLVKSYKSFGEQDSRKQWYLFTNWHDTTSPEAWIFYLHHWEKQLHRFTKVQFLFT